MGTYQNLCRCKARKRVSLFLALLLFSLGFSTQEAIPQTHLDRRIAALDRKHPSPISLELVGVDVRNVLKAFSKQTGINIVIAEDVKGPTTVRLQNVSAVQALEAILRSKGLNWYLADADTVVVSAKNQGLTQTYRLRYTDAGNLKTTLDGVIEPEKGQVSINVDNNSVVVRADLDTMRKIADTIEGLDVFPEQVVIEASVLEIKLNDLDALGVQWNQLLRPISSGGLQTVGLAKTASDIAKANDHNAGLFVGITSALWRDKVSLETLVNLLKNREDINILASPRLLVMNHKEASILVGDRLGFKTTITTQTGTAQNVRFLEVGTQLKVTPHINEDGFIRMQITPKVSSGKIKESGGGGAGNELVGLPEETTTESSTEVVVADGQTVVIGGLMREDKTAIERGVPLLKDIPLLGLLFRSKELKDVKREVVIFMTPRLFTPAMAAEMKGDVAGALATRAEVDKEHHKIPIW